MLFNQSEMNDRCQGRCSLAQSAPWLQSSTADDRRSYDRTRYSLQRYLKPEVWSSSCLTWTRIACPWSTMSIRKMQRRRKNTLPTDANRNSNRQCLFQILKKFMFVFYVLTSFQAQYLAGMRHSVFQEYFIISARAFHCIVGSSYTVWLTWQKVQGLSRDHAFAKLPR